MGSRFGVRLTGGRPVPRWRCSPSTLLPIIASGSATFAGYITLDDTATWLAFADNALAHGRDVASLAPSSFSAVLNDNRSYPFGAFVPLGVGHQLTGQDAAWLFQPYLAFLASLLSLCLYEITGPLVARRPLRSLVAFVGAQPALLYGYAFWSGIKEVTVAYLIALIAALAAATLSRGWQLRGQLVLAVALAAVFVCLSALGAVWLAGLGLFAALLVGRRGAGRASLSLAVTAAVGLLLAAPALASAWRFVRGANASDSGNGALGNLFHPLSRLQLLGIWPAGDFRGRPSEIALTYVLLALVVVAAAFALVTAVRWRVWGLPLYVTAGVAGWVCVALSDAAGHGSPWLDGKALASASPCVLTAALAGAALVVVKKRTAVVGGVALAALCGGVLWSNALAYGQVWLAPRAQLAELERVGARFAGDGPALMTEYQPYGVRHFLRALDPEGASERRTRPVTLRTGGVLDKAQYADIDAFALPDVLVYRTLVLRSSPLASRPPSAYLPVWSGRFYEVWQRQPAAPAVLEHLSLGTEADPEAVPACSEVLRLGTLAADRGGYLLAASRRPPQVMSLAGTGLPAGWLPGVDAGSVLPSGSGVLRVPFHCGAGRAVVVLAWRLVPRPDALVRRRPYGRVGARCARGDGAADAVRFGAAPRREFHVAELDYAGPGLRPGSRGAPFLVGPLAVGVPATAARLVRVPPDAAASLCGQRLDWIEAIAPAR